MIDVFDPVKLVALERGHQVAETTRNGCPVQGGLFNLAINGPRELWIELPSLLSAGGCLFLAGICFEKIGCQLFDRF